ncbi:MAG: RNA polymerase sigma factor region1.1 domain-containing protein, partial [Elusimicrobiota bacterium]|nr:RNA polymerase sigma factor region1.1 domain-containing protein [Elusimicrobiota bacterium]
MSKDIFKDLLDQAKEHGYITYEEINRHLPQTTIPTERLDEFFTLLDDMGIPVVDREKEIISKAPQEITDEQKFLPSIPDEEIGSPLRLFLTSMAKEPLLSHEDEIRLSKNIYENVKKLRTIVLGSPITLREIRNWEVLLQQKEMTPKELMPRGKRSKAELNRMRLKVKKAVNYINNIEEEIIKLEKKLKNKRISEAQSEKLISKINTKRGKIVDKITNLNLNQDKIKRLTNKIKTIACKVRDYDKEIKKYERRFKMSPNELFKIYNKTRNKKISPAKFRKITGYTLSGIESTIINLRNITRKYKKLLNSLPLSPQELLDSYLK